MKNTIVLTSGLTGSSVYTALLARSGFWLGRETVRKVGYDTFENAELVAINKALLQQLEPSLVYEHQFDAAAVARLAGRATEVDSDRMRRFVSSCSVHAPWLWKDPRLTWTIRLWAPWLDMANTQFLMVTRDPVQAWISVNLRRHIQSLAFTRAYNDGILASNTEFLQSHGLPWLVLSFEDLLLQPQRTLDALNTHFGTALAMDDLRAVCHEPLGRKSRGLADLLKASAIYLKNHTQRDGRHLQAR